MTFRVALEGLKYLDGFDAEPVLREIFKRFPRDTQLILTHKGKSIRLAAELAKEFGFSIWLTVDYRKWSWSNEFLDNRPDLGVMLVPDTGNEAALRPLRDFRNACKKFNVPIKAFRIKGVHREVDITIYTSPMCSPCGVLKTELKKRSIPYKEINVLTATEVPDFVTTLPTTVIKYRLGNKSYVFTGYSLKILDDILKVVYGSNERHNQDQTTQ